MSKFHWILDNGHGGMIDGVYQTKGKRSPEYPEGQIFEGVYNREVVDIISRYLCISNIDHTILVPEQEDTSLPDRVERIHKLYKKHSNAIVVSTHLNGGGGTGFEVYTSKGETFSDKIATMFYKYFDEHSDFRMRPDIADGDPDKEAQFYILRKTLCPAILVENLFMDNHKDFMILNSSDGKNKIAQLNINAIINCEKYL